MSADTEQRRLAAIMFTDIVGYTALTQRDEALALRLLEEHRRVVREVLATHGGVEVKTTGDGFLLEFASALSAVECAVAIQQALAARNQAEPPERQVRIRIGIHLGDVVSRDGDVYGDGVNIAARIERLAEPGGICISGAVYDQIENNVNHPLVQLTKPQLRNIQATVEAYRLLLDGGARARKAATWKPRLPARARWPLAFGILGVAALSLVLHLKGGARALPAGGGSHSAAAVTAAASEQQSVAVLPFANMSADRDNEYLSDGITEELLHALARVPGLRVPARTSSFAFKGKNEDARKVGDLLHVAHLLEGSVQRAGNQLRITAQLINAADGYQLWSETYDRRLTSVFAIEDEITKAIVGRLKVTLGGASGAAAARRPENIEAWELYLKGLFYVAHWTEASLNQAVACFSQSLEKQPDYAEAYSMTALAYEDMGYFGYWAPRRTRELMTPAVAKALELEDTLAEAHDLLAETRFYDWDWRGDEGEYRRAIELDPSSMHSHYDYAIFLLELGRLQEAQRELGISRRLDPLNPDPVVDTADALARNGEFPEALEVCRQARSIDPGYWFVHEGTGYILFRNNQPAEGIAEMETAVRLDPGSRPLGALGRMYGRVGRRVEAKRVLGQLLNRKRSRYVPAYCFAWVYEGLRDFEQANVWMRRAIADREFQLVDLRGSADDLNRANPYFPEWLKKIGLDKVPARPAGAT